MKKYLVLFVAPIEAYDKMKQQMKEQSSTEQNKGMDEWTKWMENHKSEIVDPGAAVGTAKRVAEDGTVSDVRNTVGGYMIIQADSADAAAEIFKDIPHMGMKDAAIEIMECVPMS